MHQQVVMQIEQIERECGLAGKRVADVPELANFRRKYRWRFYRLADAGIFMTIFNVVLATAPQNPTWWLSLLGGLPLSGSLIWFAEGRARLMSRQLNRRAAEQIWLDKNGYYFV